MLSILVRHKWTLKYSDVEKTQKYDVDNVLMKFALTCQGEFCKEQSCLTASSLLSCFQEQMVSARDVGYGSCRRHRPSTAH